MAMSTYLFGLSGPEIDTLKANPDSVGELDSDLSVSTHLGELVNFIASGTAWPSDGMPLYGLIHGREFVGTARLENGGFGVNSPELVSEFSKSLDGLVPSEPFSDEDEYYATVEDEELYILEDFSMADANAEGLSALETVKAFYAKAASDNLGVVTYTT